MKDHFGEFRIETESVDYNRLPPEECSKRILSNQLASCEKAIVDYRLRLDNILREAQRQVGGSYEERLQSIKNNNPLQAIGFLETFFYTTQKGELKRIVKELKDNHFIWQEPGEPLIGDDKTRFRSGRKAMVAVFLDDLETILAAYNMQKEVKTVGSYIASLES